MFPWQLSTFGEYLEELIDFVYFRNMYTKTDTLTKYYQCLVGRFAMTIIVIFDQTAHLEAGLINGSVVLEESKIGFTVCLILMNLCLLLEFVSISQALPSISRSLFSTLSHSIATCLFLLFIYDSHPVSSFWIVFGCLSLPTVVWAIVSLVLEKRAEKRLA